jgi:hypothetical protein
MRVYPARFGKNPLFPTTNDFEIITRDGICGKGVISRRSFKKGELVAMITGKPVLEIMQHTLQLEPNLHLYDPWFSGYFLHSCNPNVTVNMQARTVHALRDIQHNEYILMDYAETEDILFKQFHCECGAVNCRGWITGRAELPVSAIAVNAPVEDQL